MIPGVAVDILELENAIRGIPGVLGCAIFTTADGGLSEIQAFTSADSDRGAVQDAILDEVSKRSLERSLQRVFVFELEAESLFGDRETLTRAAELAEQEARVRGPSEVAREAPATMPGGRAPLLRVVLTSSEWDSEAVVSLGGTGETVGKATGEKTPHGLQVVGQATLDAVSQVVSGADFRLKAASLVSAGGHEAVLMIVELEEGFESLGAALVRGGPVTEAAVRATLDAVNRKLAFAR